VRENITAVCYHQNAKLRLVTNVFNNEPTDKRVNYSERSPVLDHYDETKRAADQFNQVWHNFHFDHSHNELTQSLVIGWLEWGLTNCYFVYHYFRKDTAKHRKFLWELSEALLKRQTTLTRKLLFFSETKYSVFFSGRRAVECEFAKIERYSGMTSIPLCNSFFSFLSGNLICSLFSPSKSREPEAPRRIRSCLADIDRYS
jgi:hypothetical protein